MQVPYLKTEKYIRLTNSDTLLPTTKRIIQDRAEENRQRRKRLTGMIESPMQQGECYVCGQTLTETASTLKGRLENALNYLVENSFSKLSLLTPFKGDHQKEIQALLRSNDIGKQSLSGTLPEVNPDALLEIRRFIELSTNSSHKIILKDLINKYEKRPYGWPEWDTMLLLTQLLVANEINLVMDASTLSRDRIYDNIKTPSRWAKIQLIRKKTLDSHTLQMARQLGKDIFASMGPDGEEPLFLYLQQSARQWHEQLKSFKPLADTGNYPGKTTIDQSIKLLDQCLHEKDSYSFIENFNALKNQLLDLSDDYHDLHSFYQNQQSTWKKLTDAYQLALQNRHSLDKNPDAVNALTQIENILQAEEPYGLISQADHLITQINAINKQLIDEKRQNAVSFLNTQIEQVQKELLSIQADTNLSNQCLYPLQQYHQEITHNNSIAHLFELQSIIRDEKDAALEKIAQAMAAKQKPTEPGVIGEPSPVYKKPVIIKPRELTHQTYLENEAQVGKFLNELGVKLKNAVDNGDKIEIR